MLDKLAAKFLVAASMIMNSAMSFVFKAPAFTYEFTCVGADGEIKWSETIHNVVTTQGLNDLLDKYFKGSGYSALWYLGLKGTGAVAVGNTAASHAAWSEVNPYTGNRPAITFGTTSAGANTATANSFACTSSATVAGAFIQSVNTGTGGVLYSAADFSASRSVINGDTLNVGVTVSAA